MPPDAAGWPGADTAEETFTPQPQRPPRVKVAGEALLTSAAAVVVLALSLPAVSHPLPSWLPPAAAVGVVVWLIAVAVAILGGRSWALTVGRASAATLSAVGVAVGVAMHPGVLGAGPAGAALSCCAAALIAAGFAVATWCCLSGSTAAEYFASAAEATADTATSET